MIDRYDKAYMDMAERWGKLSHALRRCVGALVVRDRQIISDGYNGTPTGFLNACEDAEGKTLPHVLHAESNALAKLARSTQSSEGSTLYVTLSPCYDCAKQIAQSGIERVVYKEAYRDLAGVEFLEQCGVLVEQINGQELENRKH
jgi:dCMP deaminase